MREEFLGALPRVGAVTFGCALVLASAIGERYLALGDPGFGGAEASLATAGVALIFVGVAPALAAAAAPGDDAGRLLAGPLSGTPLAVWLAGTALVLLALLALENAGVLVDNMLRDPVSLGRLSPSAGSLNALGLMLWGMAVGVCLIGSLLLARTPGRSEDARFMLATGALTTLAMADDAFLIHEQVTSNRYLGWSEAWVLGAYGTLTLLWATRFRRELGRSNLALLSAAALGFGGSTFLDPFDYDAILEDGPKLMAIVALLLYSLSEVRRRTIPSGGPIVRA